MGLVKRGEIQIIQRYRPRKFSQVLGCEDVKKSLTKWMESGNNRSKSLLLMGSSGCGKSTLARILAMGLNCQKGDTVQPCLECDNCKQALSGNALHIHDLNIGSLGTKEDVDNIVEQMYESSLTGRNNVWIFDEAQQLTTASANLLLKPIQNPPPNTYIIFATTQPQKILKTLQNRCQKYEFKNPGKKQISLLLSDVSKQQKIELKTQDKQILFDYVQGMSYRQILNVYNQFINGGISCLNSIGNQKVINYWELCKIVQKGDFFKFLQIVNGNQNIDCQAFRRMMRVYLVQRIQKTGFVKKSLDYVDVFKIFDCGFFTDPNPLPTLKVMVFNACVIFKG